jgi:uncharacterized repeat protein (TIGR03803 family)
VATSRIPWQPLIGLLALIVVMSVVVLSGQELKHVPPAAPAYIVLYSFAGYPTDGSFPTAGLLRDASGNLYGTTARGGPSGVCLNPNGCGRVFKLSPTGTETVLHSFTGGADGSQPLAGLVPDAAGNLYGTASQGGTSGAGVVFKVTPTGTATVLYSFTGGADGGGPLAGLVRDVAGNLYGTTQYGGSSTACQDGCGTVFELSSTGTETVLHSFVGNPTDGWQPLAGLVRDAAGNLYGTTSQGGTGTCQGGACFFPGVVFKLSPSGTETVLYNFKGGADGNFPSAGLIQDPAGNLYGTTTFGGATSASCPNGCGVVFKLSPCGSGFKVLYSFTGGAEGSEPQAGLVRDGAGNLYGTTVSGGASGVGVVFKLTPTGTYKVLHSFTGGADGAYPYGGLVQDGAGNLYGTTKSGGLGDCEISGRCFGCGVVFKLTP